jgi:ferredoxin
VIRIGIDRRKCVGSGNCIFWAPATFDLDDEGISVVIDPSGDAEDRIRVAVEGCPSKAIWMESADQPEAPVSEDRREGGHGDRLVR